ncbi:PASTA domain-containing protein [Cellulomonas soli]|uniref:PASTA domain-containing protein n=1 Tax=Cellulomonas soli TaxID=931535 RepID=A0A512PHH6_9CELL|nr:hypothetical protein [Cellulomonas soli]NYI60844.1 PBP1b-binding outer membrane lipoprotein LpoB [Cellulomonas soli]GEP70572.1 hypothetical protein CSO01_32870 [Cellulomonas soli]
MKQSIVRSGVIVAFAAALLAGCSDSGSDSAEETTPAATTATTESVPDGQVEVTSQTNLLLVTAQETLEASGLTVEAVDVSGQGRAIDDPTTWVVVSQDPETGTVDAGTTVTLQVRMTTDPAS